MVIDGQSCAGCGDPLILNGPDSTGKLDPNVKLYLHTQISFAAVLVVRCSKSNCRTFNFLPLGLAVESALALPCRKHEYSDDMPDFLLAALAEAGYGIDVIGSVVIDGKVLPSVFLITTWDLFMVHRRENWLEEPATAA